MTDLLIIALDIAIVVFCVIGVIAVFSLIVEFFDDRRLLREIEEKAAREKWNAEVDSWRKNGGL